MTMRSGRLFKNGQKVTHASARAQARKLGYSLDAKGLKKFYKAEGYTLKGASLTDQAQALAITMLIEEGKMQFMGLPTRS